MSKLKELSFLGYIDVFMPPLIHLENAYLEDVLNTKHQKTGALQPQETPI